MHLGMTGVTPVGTVTSPRLSKFQSSKKKYTVNNTTASMSDLDQRNPGWSIALFTTFWKSENIHTKIHKWDKLIVVCVNSRFHYMIVW